MRSAFEKIYLASYYSSEKKKTYTYSDEQISSYYDSHKTDFDVVDYRSFTISGQPEEKKDASGKTSTRPMRKEGAMDAAKKKPTRCWRPSPPKPHLMRLPPNTPRQR
jgi:hypothetical protein